MNNGRLPIVIFSASLGCPLYQAEAGGRYVSRVGVSLLHVAGLSEYIAETVDEFVAIAQAVAEDIDGLEELRSGLRERWRSR